MIRLSRRLQAIYDWIDGEVIADVGCDHGYIAFMVYEQKGKKVYACDVAEKPLKRAQTFFKAQNALIDGLLMDGIQGLPADVDQVVIAGMGGQLICSILEQGKEDLKMVESLILSPHKNAKELREYLVRSGFAIIKERVVKEGNHFYPILYVKKGPSTLTLSEALYGKNVVTDSDYLEFLQKQIDKWTNLKERIPASLFEEGQKQLNILNHLKAEVKNWA